MGDRPIYVARWGLAITIVLAVAAPAAAQRRTLSLPEAVELAITAHPAARRAVASERAARAGVRIAESALWPRIDVSLALQRATGNVVPGTVLALPSIPGLSGPPQEVQFDEGVWGSGIGGAASFDVGAFPRREGERDAALADLDARASDADATRLEIAARVARAYVDVVAAQAQRLAVAAWLERAATLVRVTDALVEQELRPGADAARARAEQAAASALEARAAQAELVARAALSAELGDPGLDVEVDASVLDDLVVSRRTAQHGMHALERARRSELEAARLVRRSQVLAYVPRIELVAALWARGSGIDAPSRASDLGDAAGLLPNVPNWAVGFVLSYSLLDLPLLDARLEQADARVEEADAALEAQVLELRALSAQADARLEGARGIATAARAVVASYEVALTQAVARFEAGLTTMLDVVDAQRALAEAQLEEVTARAEVLRASYDLAFAAGDLDAFRARGED
ncbi:Hypothetical protein I5071_89520 [Sandaracinus amylolyticus]|nr:Hypothetical protein I5071_89520 [Sandaracinus amylolyticus]